MWPPSSIAAGAANVEGSSLGDTGFALADGEGISLGTQGTCAAHFDHLARRNQSFIATMRIKPVLAPVK